MSKKSLEADLEALERISEKLGHFDAHVPHRRRRRSSSWFSRRITLPLWIALALAAAGLIAGFLVMS